MGLLDDAIREHLELKKQHGADPEEVERLEAEALAEPTAEETAVDSVESAAQSDVITPEEDAEYEAAIEAEEVMSADEVPLAEETVSEPPPPEPVQKDQAEQVNEEPAQEEVVEEVAAPAATAEVPSTKPVAGDDLLEETPDFLEETPEHDQLWFEQNKPTDFDFND